LSQQEPSSLHIFTHNPYYYLSDAQTRFSPELDLDLDIKDKVDFFLYIYIICNNTNFDPYLACLLKYDEASKSYSFPKITYDPVSLKEDETHDVFIQNMCYEIIYPLFQIDETQVTSEFIEYTKDCFKGSFKGYLCFNAEKFLQYLKGNEKNLSEHFHKQDTIPPYTWACIYEIVTKKRVHTIAIHPDVVDAFNEYEWLREIKNEHNENTEVPMMLYSCTIQNNKIDYSLDKTKMLPPVSYHPVLERVRLFTVDLDDGKDAFQMPRYIVFLGDVTENTFKHDDNTLVYGVFSSDRIYNF